MSQSGAIQGVPFDLSRMPAKSESCILSKQVRNSIPKIREGLKATRPLEKVHIDLTGPVSVASRSGNQYGMNMVDDFILMG